MNPINRLIGGPLKEHTIDRLVDIIDRLPLPERAEVWRGIALSLSARLSHDRREGACTAQ